jgi:hypothetical protein
LPRRAFIRELIGFEPAGEVELEFTPFSIHVVFLEDDDYFRAFARVSYGVPGDGNGLEAAMIREMVSCSGGFYCFSWPIFVGAQKASGLLTFDRRRDWRTTDLHERAHLRFQRYMTGALLWSSMLRNPAPEIVRYVDRLEKTLLDRGLIDPDLRASLFLNVFSHFFFMQNEASSIWAESDPARIPVQSLKNFTHWFKDYYASFEKIREIHLARAYAYGFGEVIEKSHFELIKEITYQNCRWFNFSFNRLRVSLGDFTDRRVFGMAS